MTGSARSWAARRRTISPTSCSWDDQGQKISKSSGNGIGIDEWLTYASTESLSLFPCISRPKTAKRLYFDVIPRAMDEYHQQLRAYPDQTPEQRAANPVWHIHSGDVPASDMVVSYSMLLNLASVSSAEDRGYHSCGGS